MGIAACQSVDLLFHTVRSLQGDRRGLCIFITGEFDMVPPRKTISLSDIHDVYRGTVKERDTAEVEQSYRKTDRFKREAGHSGVAPNRPAPFTGRKSR
ncbi:hypothetical protein [Dyella jiangningensis]|uniref:hypothetical protein n=1 Tax=Dyella jiangningensis TaxID=1379159 RepID=UPI0011BE283C|nr:hypothetical protein [Dyella jiangningensis]